MVFEFSDLSMSGTFGIEDMPLLLSIYFAAIMFMQCVLALMYRHALKYRMHLDLNDEETDEARKQFITSALVVPMFSILLFYFLPPEWIGFGSFPAVVIGVLNRAIKKKRIKLDWIIPKARPLPEEEQDYFFLSL